MSRKYILIVESPTKVKTLSKFLSSDFEIISCVGHVKDLPRKSLGVDVDQDFAMEEDILDDKKQFFRELKKLAKSAEKIIIATDPDREGEAIAKHIAEEVSDSLIERVQFTEITKAGIHEGMSQPGAIDINLVEARKTRRIIDRLVGYKVSRVLWSTLQNNMNFVNKALSAGRVQSAALRILVNRERLRAKFNSASYYGLKAELKAIESEGFPANLRSVKDQSLITGKDFDSTTGELKRQGGLFLNQAQADALAEELLPGPWTVEDIVDKPRSSNPKPPFTTSTIQQEAARKLHFPARRTMRTAQKLYENGYITYMRTDSTHLSDEALKASRDYITKTFGNEFMSEKPNVYKTKVKNAQEAHEAIRPAGSTFASVESATKDLGDDAGKLYDLIWKRTIASQMAPAKLKQTTVTIKNQSATFRATGRVILFPGYMKIYVEGSDDSSKGLEDRESVLPDMKKGDTLNCLSLNAEEHNTKPPARFTEASLVKELESDGIGRPSTFANIIDTILFREYVTKTKGALVPTFLGVAVTQLLENHFEHLVSTQFTAQMENDLDSIARGEMQALPFMHDFYFGNDKDDGLQDMLDDPVDIPRACIVPLNGKDGDELIIRIGKFGPYVQQGEERRNIPVDLALGDITIEKAMELLAQSDGPVVIGTDPKSSVEIVSKVGPYGPYVQRGETTERKSIPKHIDPASIDLETALALLNLPRTIGSHPETSEEITADYGRYGPYLRMVKKTRSLKDPDTPLDITLERAVELLEQATSGRSEALKELGKHPKTGEELTVKSGRYGPFISDGKVNAAIPKGVEPEDLSLEDAVELIDKRRLNPPKKRRKKRKKS